MYVCVVFLFCFFLSIPGCRTGCVCEASWGRLAHSGAVTLSGGRGPPTEKLHPRLAGRSQSEGSPTCTVTIVCMGGTLVGGRRGEVRLDFNKKLSPGYGCEYFEWSFRRYSLTRPLWAGATFLFRFDFSLFLNTLCFFICVLVPMSTCVFIAPFVSRTEPLSLALWFPPFACS